MLKDVGNFLSKKLFETISKYTKPARTNTMYFQDYVIDKTKTLPRNPDPKRLYQVRALDTIKRIIVHCDDWGASVERVATYDVSPSKDNHLSPLGCPQCTYNFFIDKDGNISYAVDLSKITWHAGNHNADSIAICLSYRATNSTTPPTDFQVKALIKLCKDLCLDLCVDPDNVLGHRELIDTGYTIVNGIKKLRKTCPGLLLNLDTLRCNISKEVQLVLAGAKLLDEVDGIFGPKSEKALKAFQQYKGTR